MAQIALIYAYSVKRDRAAFVRLFLNCKSVRNVCVSVVAAFKRDGSLDLMGGDFSGYANKQSIESAWRPVLADILKIIYNITRD